MSGARIVCGGGRPEDDRLANGFYYPPTLVDGIDSTHPMARQEIFGPVLVVLPWRRLDEAVEVANGVRYGLTASVFTNDLGAALTLVRRLEAGYVWVNGVSHHQLGTPFGGVKDSGYGREGGIEGLMPYQVVKNVSHRMAIG